METINNNFPEQLTAFLLTNATTITELITSHLIVDDAPAAPAPKAADDFTLDADAIAQRLGRSRRWVFRNQKTLPFIRRVSRKSLLASVSGLNKWIASRK